MSLILLKYVNVIVGILFFVIGIGLLISYEFIYKNKNVPLLYISDHINDYYNNKARIKIDSTIKNNFFMYNPSIYWKNKTNIGVISRVSGHNNSSRLNKCINIIQSNNDTGVIDYIHGLTDYMNIFGKKMNGCSGIIHYSLNIDTGKKDTPLLINPFFTTNNLSNKKCLGFEDPRVFKFMEKMWIITSFRGVNFPFPSTIDTTKFGHYVIIFPIDMSYNPVILNYEHMQHIEKNWMPFEFKNELYIVYSIVPHIILHVDIKTGKCVQKYTTIFNNKHKDIGNGAPPQLIYINDTQYFIGLGHTRGLYNKSMIRKNFFYMFDATPPFSIKYISDVFNIMSPFVYIEFGSGLLIDQENNLVYLSYGQDDCLNSISTLTLTYVLSILGITDYDSKKRDELFQDLPQSGEKPERLSSYKFI